MARPLLMLAAWLPLATPLRVAWAPRRAPMPWMRMSAEPEAMPDAIPPDAIPPVPEKLYVAEKEDFEASAELVAKLQKDALRAVNKLQLGVVLTRENVREVEHILRNTMQEVDQIDGLSEDERIALYANDLFMLAQRSVKPGMLVGHMALTAVLLPVDTDPTLVVKAQMTAIRRIAFDTPSEGQRFTRLVAGRMLLLFGLAPFPEDYIRPGLATDAMSVFLNVRSKDERAEAQGEAAKEGWDTVLDSIVKQPVQSGDLDALPVEGFAAWEATARMITKHALVTLEPEGERTVYALAMSAREQGERAMDQQAARGKSGKVGMEPLTRGLVCLRLYVELMVLASGRFPTPQSFYDVSKEFLKGSAVSSGLGSLRTYAQFSRVFMQSILEGKRNPSTAAGVDCMLLSQILGMSPMDIIGLGREAFEAEVGAMCAALATDLDAEMPKRPNWATVLTLLTVPTEDWGAVLEEALRPLVQKKLGAGVAVGELTGDEGVRKAGAFLGFDDDALDAAVRKQVLANLASLVQELQAEVSEAVREATSSLGIGKGMNPDELPAVTEDGVKEVLSKVELLGLSPEDAEAVVVKAAKAEIRNLCTEALKLEQERNVKGGALMLVRALGLATGLVQPVLEALGDGEAMDERELCGRLGLRTMLSEQLEMAVSEIGWGMRQDPSFEGAGGKIMVLFGMA